MNLLETAQIMYVADLGILGWLDYKFRGAYRVFFIPCWMAMVLAALSLIRAVTLFYAVELSAVTLLLICLGFKLRYRIGDGDIWLFLGFMWCFATSPFLLIGTALGTFILAFAWPDSHAVPMATCLAIALGAVWPATWALGLYHW